MQNKTIAMILCAGYGTRMRPLTDAIPKALIMIGDKTLLEHNLEHISRFGIHDFVINTHYCADVLTSYVTSHLAKKFKIKLIHEPETLLDTGGGVWNAVSLFKDFDTILIYNVDILSSIDLTCLLDNHRTTNALCTLAVTQRSSSRYLLFMDKQLVGWHNTKTNEEKWVNEKIINAMPYAFSGIHLVQKNTINLYPRTGSFSIIDMYLKIAAQQNVFKFDHTNDVIIDVGTPSQIEPAIEYLRLYDKKYKY